MNKRIKLKSRPMAALYIFGRPLFEAGFEISKFIW